MSLVELTYFEPMTGSGIAKTEEEQAWDAALLEEYQRGFQQGLADMEQEYQTKTATQAAHILARINELYAEIQAIEERVESQAGAVGAAAINAVLPELSQRGMADEMALAVRELIGRLEMPRLRISAPGPLIDALRQALEETGAEIPIPLSFEVDEAAGDGRAKLEWPRGAAEFDHGDMLSRLTRTLEKLMTPNNTQTAVQSHEGASQ